MIHYYPASMKETPLPKQFTCPFHYTPHPLCVMAAQKVQAYLKRQKAWQEELRHGKMFGVLVVQTKRGKLGFLAAYSGILAGSNMHPYFVPPIYDLLNLDGYFHREEENISAINHRIEDLESSFPLQEAVLYWQSLKEEAKKELTQARADMKAAKENRDRLRASGTLLPEQKQALIAESQFQKAELKRLSTAWNARMAEAEIIVNQLRQEIDRLKEERKTRSAALQHWLFSQYRVLNANGKVRDLYDIFRKTPQGVPPAGSGECAAPKLLQYAYLHGMKPIAMAEFWWGDSPKGEVRHHGYYYPACKSKCEPILNYMLSGLKVMPNPLTTPTHSTGNLEIMYEDEHLIVVNKPAGMLSVPGKSKRPSVYTLLYNKFPEATGPLLVHRLDMDTSGLLIAAKSKDVHALLQKQFEGREVKKRYIALLNGIPDVPPKGFIRLPLRPDYDHRPCQMVDKKQGKPAITRYETIVHDSSEHTRIALYPLTGRTHQLRVHAAHAEGLHCPILGDPLYGRPSDRLYLHAEQLEFRHPISGEWIRIEAKCPF